MAVFDKFLNLMQQEWKEKRKSMAGKSCYFFFSGQNWANLVQLEKSYIRKSSKSSGFRVNWSV